MPTLTAKEEEVRGTERTYNVQIQETLTLIIPIEAASYEEAERIAAEMYDNEEVILSADDFDYVTFSNAEEEKET